MIYVPPEAKSFNDALGRAFLVGLRAKGHGATVIDLYRARFDPILVIDEIRI